MHWEIGESFLEKMPNKKEITVYYYHWEEGICWEYKVVREKNTLKRKIFLNGGLVQ
jgi:hypothetical protein